MGIVAIIPADNAPAANAALAAFGTGSHFTVSGLASSGLTHVGLHDWGTAPTYVAAVKALPGVVWNEGTGDPATRLRALFAGVTAQWPMEAPPLPASGLTVAGVIYSYVRTPGSQAELWLSISAFNRTTFPLVPETYPSLLRQRRWPGEVLPWKQPIDGFDSYHAVDVITGQPDRVTHNGKTWDCLIANNVSQPGVANWREFVASGFPAWLQPTGAGDAYPVGFRVTHLGQNWQNTSPANTFAPGVFGWVTI